MDSPTNVDARTALGVRSGARPRPQLRLSTAALNGGYSDNMLASNAADTSETLYDHPPSPQQRPQKRVSISIPAAHQRESFLSATDGGSRLVSSATAASSSSSSRPPVANTSLTMGHTGTTTSPDPPHRQRRGTIRRTQNVAAESRASGVAETRKMLSLVLEKLDERALPPDILDRAAMDARQQTGPSKGKGRVAALGGAMAAAAVGAGQRAGTAVAGVGNSVGSGAGAIIQRPEGSANGAAHDEEDGHPEEEVVKWDTNATYELVIQTRDILTLGGDLDLFGASAISAADALAAAKSKRTKRRKSSIGRPMRSPGAYEDPDIHTAAVSGPELMEQLSNALHRLITVDCIHSTVKFRLRKPAHALQATCLDIATVLYHKGDYAMKLKMINLIIDALYGMPDPMKERLCEWLEGRLGEMLQLLAKERGLEDKKDSIEWNDPFASTPKASPAVPTFAFSVESDTGHLETGDKPGWMRFSPTTASPPFDPPWGRQLSGILSTLSVASPASRLAIQIAALIPRILAALTSTIDLTTAKLMTIYRVHRILSLIFNAKPDAALDLLEIVAHGTGRSRKRAIDILATFFPQAMGHNVIARRPALFTYQSHLTKWETGQDRVLAEEDTEGHSYIPWRADTKTRNQCSGCQLFCEGFCVRCTLCGETKHTSCLDLFDDEVFQYQVAILDEHGEQVKAEKARVEFSKSVPRLDEKVLTGGPTRGTPDATVRRAGEHELHLVNLFTLTLCGECYEPLWGTTAQAYACTGQCQRLFHPACVQEMYTRGHAICEAGYETYVSHTLKDDKRERHLDPFSITVPALIKSLQSPSVQVYRGSEYLADMTYDELAIVYDSLWAQFAIYRNGLQSGALRIVTEPDDPPDSDPTGMAKLLELYEEEMALDKPMSSVVENLGPESEHMLDTHFHLFTPQYLQLCAAMVRSPVDPNYEPPAPPSPTYGGFLTVEGQAAATNDIDPPSLTYEVVYMSTVRQVLFSDLKIGDNLAASILLEQLRHFGLCNIANVQLVSPVNIMDNSLPVSFPLPLLMDTSPSVELLVLTIEQLLDEIDLTANEQALALLYNRAWPSIACSEYALERLGSALMYWIMAEDDVLHHIVKNYASKKKRPPGVRTAGGAAGRGTSVATYKDDRERLLERYGRPWLMALHERDPGLYTDWAYECAKVVDNRFEVVEIARGEEQAAEQMASIALNRITALSDSNVIFSASLDLLTAWLEDLGGLVNNDVVYKSLPRLLRYTNLHIEQGSPDLWLHAKETSEESVEGLERVCRWMRVLTLSGVEVSWELLQELVDLQDQDKHSDESRYDLVAAVSANNARMEPELFAKYCTHVFVKLVDSEHRHAPSAKELEMLRLGMTTILRAYGTLPEDIVASSLHMKDREAKAAASQKRRGIKDAARPWMVEMDSKAVLTATNILRRDDYPAEMVLDFLWLLFTKATAVDNPDGFIHHIASAVYEVLWPLYDRTVDRRSRLRLFLKLLTINSAPIKNLVSKEVEGLDRSIIRERLLVFVLEVADDSITNEVNDWRRSAVGLIMLFFNGVILPSQPTPDNLVVWKGFLPTHLRAMSFCFEEYLVACSDEQRLHLLSQLQQLRLMVPKWPIIDWHVIEELVAEQVSTIARLESVDSDKAFAALTDARAIRASVLALGLYMLAAGVQCEWALLQRFQQHVAATCVLPWPIPSTTITGILLPALKAILDSAAYTSNRSNANETPPQWGEMREVRDTREANEKNTLVGSLFVPIVINFANDLGNHDFMVQRYILDILLVVFFKHNVGAVEFAALETLETVAKFAATSDCTENQVLALQVLNTAQLRMSRDRLTRVVARLFPLIAELVVKQNESATGDSAVVDACRTFLHTAITELGQSGLVMQVLRVDAESTNRGRAPETIGRAIQMACAKDPIKTIWLDHLEPELEGLITLGRRNIAKMMPPIGRLYGSLEDEISEGNVTDFTKFLTNLGKHVAGYDSVSDFDPNPLLQAAAAVMKLSPAQTVKELMTQTGQVVLMSLSQYNVQLEVLRSLVGVSQEVAKREKIPNAVVTGVSEALGAAMSRNSSTKPVSPMTLHTLLTYLAEDGGPDLLLEASPGCADVVVRRHKTLDACPGDAERTMGILSAAANVLVKAEIEAPGNAGRVLVGLPSRAAIDQIDAFTHLLYASLSVTLRSARVDIVSLYPVLARATSLQMSAAADLLTMPDPNGDGGYYVSKVIGVLQIAVLAVSDSDRDPRQAAYEGRDALALFFRRIWPDWDRLLNLSVDSAVTNTPLRDVVKSSYLDTVLFVAANQPALLTESAPQIARGLRTIEEWHAAQNTAPPPKLAKAVAAFEAAVLARDAPLPDRAARDATVKAMWITILATERVFALRSAMDGPPRLPTRGRNVAGTHRRME